MDETLETKDTAVRGGEGSETGENDDGGGGNGRERNKG